VRWASRWNEEKALQLQNFRNFLGGPQMAEMDRIKSAPKES
jgi:hypothetical protein